MPATLQLVSVDDHHVYGAPLCEIGKHVLGQSGTFVKLQVTRDATNPTHDEDKDDRDTLYLQSLYPSL